MIQKLIAVRDFKTYLEIGVLGGKVFFDVRCQKKIAVDPNFLFNWKGRLGETVKNLSNVNASFYEVKSNDFFTAHAPSVFASRKLDIALVDGMHEFDYALDDVLNCLKYLSDDGVIVMHDCNPLTSEAECSFDQWKSRNYGGHWNGDVWKVIPFLRKFRPDLDVFVADTDHGLGIISKRQGSHGSHGSHGSLVDGDRATFRNMTYSNLAAERAELLNLKPISHLQEFLSRTVVAR